MSRVASALPASHGRVVSSFVGDPESFFENHWERAPVLLPDAISKTPEFRLGAADVEAALTNPMLRMPFFLMMKDGVPVEPSKFTRTLTVSGVAVPDLVDAGAALREYEAGATAVLREVSNQIPRLAGPCAELAAEFGARVIAHMFLTPGNAQGYGWHRDAEDNFVVQLAGTKRFEIAQGRQQLGVRGRLPDDEPRVIESEVEVFDISPGDILYIPSGCPHCASNHDQSASLHIAIWIHREEWAQIVGSALRSATQAMPVLAPLNVDLDDARQWLSNLGREAAAAMSSASLAPPEAPTPVAGRWGERLTRDLVFA